MQAISRRVEALPPGALAPLAASLRADMDRVLRDAPAISGQKAMLTRDGGRCPIDGAPLEFDPYSPHAHRCPQCGTVQTGERHHRWWLMFAQLWRAERAVHAATLHALRGEPVLAAFARATLDEYADRYSRYPLDDNVLGPSRPFFSTYLESIWLLQLCIAADLLDAAERWRQLDRALSRARRNAERCAHRLVRRGGIESAALEQRRAPRRRAHARRRAARRARDPLAVGADRAARERPPLRWKLVRGRELPSLLASRPLVRRHDGRGGGDRDSTRAARALSGGLLHALSHRVSRSRLSRAARLAVRRIAPPVAHRGVMRARARARGRRATHRRARRALRATTFRIATPAAGARRPSPSATSRRAR